jgi:serine/threonine-protein kinase RsbW
MTGNHHMIQRFKKETASLTAVFAYLDAYLQTAHAGDESAYAVQLAVEELFTNMVKYNPESSNDITITVEGDGKRIVVTLVDTDVEPFDMTAQKEVDTTAALSQRKVGGLGIHIVKNLVDDLKYEYADRCSKVTVIKQLER